MPAIKADINSSAGAYDLLSIIISLRLWRRDGLMVSALVSECPNPGRGHCVVFSDKTVPLSTQVYKWVRSNFNAAGNPAMD